MAVLVLSPALQFTVRLKKQNKNSLPNANLFSKHNPASTTTTILRTTVSREADDLFPRTPSTIDPKNL